LDVENIKPQDNGLSLPRLSNIKRAGRLSVAFDVLEQAVKTCPKDLLPESLKQILDRILRRNSYRSRASEVKKQITNPGLKIIGRNIRLI